MLPFGPFLYFFDSFSISNEAFPPDPDRVSAESRADDETKGAGDGSTNKASSGKNIDLPRENANLESRVDTGTGKEKGSGDAEMFANMFETAIGMAAEAMERQLGGGDSDQEEDYDEEREEEDHEAFSLREKEDSDGTGEGRESDSGADDDD